MRPLRRGKKSPSDQDADAAMSAEENAAGTTANYLSFQDNGGEYIEDDQANGLRESPGRRFIGGVRRIARDAGVNNENASTHPHRGFATSIHDMFQSHETERIDCCAMTCCGMMQSDRDRYFLQGVAPPSLLRRLWLHIVFPCFLFSIAGYAAMNIPDNRINNLFTTGTLLLMIYYLVLQCSKGRAKRIEIRKDLLWTKAQVLDQRRQNLSVILEQERPDDHSEEQEYYLGQRRRDFYAAHPCLCHCYVEDRLAQRDISDADESGQASMCTRIWEWFCAPCCGMHLQLCGVCALAQEGREVETALLPSSYLRVDYITMQPYADYYPAIYEARHQGSPEDNDEAAEDAPTQSSWPRLSRLSVQILQVLATLVVFLAVWAFAGRLFWKYVLTANIPAWRLFGLSDMVVFFVTWAQALGLLGLFVWLANRYKDAEISWDALIKYYAAGFCLSTTMAIFWEVSLGLIVRILVNLCLALAGVDLTERPGTQATFSQKFGQALGDNNSRNFLQTYGNDHPVFFTLYLILASFALAAFVEEMCKYYGYRMVEHPDFLSKRELEDAMNVVHGENEEDPDASRQERHDFSKQRRSLQSHGAAVTVAMVAVAMGFTCCENLVYVFVYSGSSLEMELQVLLARSFFPVHALAAALQSIGVVERDVEGRRTSRLGRIIGPAVLFHGCYDFLLLWIDFLAERHGIYADDDDDLIEWPVLLSFLSSLLVMASALWYYMQQSRKQRNRLIEMDRDESAVRSSLI